MSAPLGQARQRLAAEVRGQHDQGVAEIDRAPLPVGQAAVVEHLQQHVEDVGVRLFDLVEQDHLVGPAPHRLGQARRPRHSRHSPAARRSAATTECFSMYSDMSMRTIALSSSNRNSASALVSSVLPTPVGPRNRNEPIGRFGSCNPARARRIAFDTATTASSWPITRRRRFSSMLQQLFALARQHLVDRDAGPARHDAGDVLGGHRLFEHAALFRALGFLELAFELGDHAVGQFAGAAPIAAALRLVELGAGLVELLLELLRAGELVLLGLPLRRSARPSAAPAPRAP